MGENENYSEGRRESRMKYGAKKDINHNEIVGVLTGLGVPFLDMSSLGCGVPDGMAEIAGRLHLVEIKNDATGYGKNGLNTIQIKWLAQWRGGGVYILRSKEDAIEFARGHFDRLPYLTPEDAQRALINGEKLGCSNSNAKNWKPGRSR